SFFFSSRRRHTRSLRDWSSDVCSSDLNKCDLSTCDPHWRRQVDHTFFPALNFSCVARVEQLEEGLRPLAEHLGLSKSFVGAGKRSEERRVGKECRGRWSPEHKKKRTTV